MKLTDEQIHALVLSVLPPEPKNHEAYRKWVIEGEKLRLAIQRCQEHGLEVVRSTAGGSDTPR